MTAAHAEPSTTELIGERVHHLMFRRRLTQVAVASELGITQTALSRKLRGERPWYPDELATVARLLDVTVGALFGERTVPGGNVPPDGPLAQLAELRTFNPNDALARVIPIDRSIPAAA